MTEKQEHDIDGLLRKNAELLGEVKALKAKVAEIEAERDGARSEAQAAQETMRRVQLEEPLERAAAPAFAVPWRIVRPLIEEHFDIALGEDGAPQITAKASGEAVPLDGLVRAAQAVPDLAVALRPISGPDVRGGASRGRDPRPDPQPKVASPFGLR